jgi:hypothetical protein
LQLFTNLNRNKYLDYIISNKASVDKKVFFYMFLYCFYFSVYLNWNYIYHPHFYQEMIVLENSLEMLVYIVNILTLNLIYHLIQILFWSLNFQKEMYL